MEMERVECVPGLWHVQSNAHHADYTKTELRRNGMSDYAKPDAKLQYRGVSWKEFALLSLFSTFIFELSFVVDIAAMLCDN